MAIVWTIGARHDLVRIFDFNAAFSTERAIFVDQRLAAAAELIARHPRAWRAVGGSDLREKSVADIQYVIRYRIDESGDIVILKVRHAREQGERP